jgi:LAO/AO transport system kinase
MKRIPTAERVLRGDRQAVARAISRLENREEGAEELLESISDKAGHAFVLGVTGPPGTGKSTLVDRLIEEYRKIGLKVGVIAIDPTSPISGGALLGDRIRMKRHTMDSGVFIRSMASRGWVGGLSGAVGETIQVLGAAGMDIVIVETVGIGQADIEIMRVAHAVIVVTVPGMGDEVQVSKAGLMEIGDIYAVNKGDLPGADSMVVDLLGMVRGLKGRNPHVLKVSALKGDGIAKLFEIAEEVRGVVMSPAGRQVRLRSTYGMVMELAKRRVLEDFEDAARKRAEDLAAKVDAGKLTLVEAANILSENK